MDQEAALLSLLASGLQHCQATVIQDGGLLASLFLTGLVGGLSHCTGMCGPFVLSQVTTRMEARPASQMREWHRLTGAALIPYHLGRTTTYIALGTVAAAMTGALGTGLRWLSAFLLLLAALVMLGYALPRLKALLGKAGGEGWWSRTVGRMARPLFGRPTGWRGYVLGLMLGFIPCGLLYAALAAAAALGQPLTAALGMAVFSLGTVPSLLGVGLVGHMAARRWRGAVLQYAPLLLVLNAGVLAYLAFEQFTA